MVTGINFFFFNLPFNFSKVYKAKSLNANSSFPLVALKMIRVEVEHEGFPLTAIREVNLLRSLNSTNLFVRLLDIVTSDSSVFLVFEYLPWDLTGLILHPQTIISPAHIKCILRQMLQGLCYLHEKTKIIHRDIKGSNFLLDRDGTVKLGDFGLARQVGHGNLQPESLKGLLTNRVITIWYRPPELLLGATDYSYEVDIWGLGCVMGELFVKRPPFCGSCEISQLECIFETLGPPPPPLLQLPLAPLLKFPSLPHQHQHDHHHPLPNTNNQLASKTLAPYKEAMCEEGWNLFLQMLTLNPNKRITASQALQHPYFMKTSLQECSKEELTTIVPGEWHEWEVKNLQKKRTS